MGKVPELIMSGEMSDVSQFCQFEWFEWMMFQDEMVLHPDDHFKLGRYICLSIAIGTAMMAKIVKENNQVFHRSTYQSLT